MQALTRSYQHPDYLRRQIAGYYASQAATRQAITAAWARQKDQAQASSGCGFLGLSCAWHGVEDAGHAMGNGMATAGRFVWNNRGTLASVVAAGVCLSGVGTALCGAFLAGAYAVRAEQRIQTYGFRRSLDANIADGVITVASAVPLAGATITFGGTLAGTSRLIINGAAAIPDAVYFAGGFLPGHDPVFFNGATLNF